MALYIPHGDGNACVVLGGFWNDDADPGNPANWDNRLKGATEMTVYLTIKPDAFYTDVPSGVYNNGLGTAIMGLAGGSTGGRSFELALYIDGGYGRMIFRVWGANDTCHENGTPAGSLVPGRLNRIALRWRARGNFSSIWINGRSVATSTGTTENAGLVTEINPNSNQTLEIGAQSLSDTNATAGEYSEFAICTRYHSDQSAMAYGSGVSPNYLENRGRWKYVTLERLESIDLGDGFDLYSTGHIHDEWQGDWPNRRLEYGGPPTKLYAFGGPQFPRSPTGVKWFPNNPLGVIHEVPHPVVWGGVSAIKPDSELLPKRDLECGELDGTSIGKRSGQTRLVPSAYSLQEALSIAGPGDNIEIDASLPQTALNNQPWRGPNIASWPTTAGTPRMPPEHQWYLDAQETLVGTVAPVGTITPDCAGMDHAYVLITSSRVSNLPAANVKRVIPLPDGEIRRVMHESGRLNASHLTNCATLIMPDNGTMMFNLAADAGAYPEGRLHFRGINFRQSDAGASQIMMNLGVDNYTPYRWNMYDNRELLPPPHHIVLNQCAFSFDPLDNGDVIAQIAEVNAPYLGIVNCFGQNLFGASGDQKLLGMSLGVSGPWHYENNEWQAATMLWLTGGQASVFVNVGPNDVTVRRNWLHAPKHWAPSEPNAGRDFGYDVNIHPYSVAISQVDRVDGQSYHQRNGPKKGCIMYRPSTGRAMYLNQDHVPSAVDYFTTTVYLSGVWPEGTVMNTVVGFQWVSGDIESTPTLYNSGTETVMPTATWTSGSRHVTFSAPIPQPVYDEMLRTMARGERLYIYPNDTIWAGENEAIGGNWTPPAKTNGFSRLQGITRAQCRRKRLVSIASDRLSLETDPTQNPYPDTITFPYSIVRFDGLFRPAFHHFKGSWENKNGAYWLQEGNVFNLTSNRLYIAGNNINGSMGPIGGRVVISGNDVTLLDADWPPAIYDIVQFRQVYGAPGLFPYLTFGFDIERPGLTRIVERITGPRTGKLLGPDPRNPDRLLGNGTYTGIGWQTNSIPWLYIYAQVLRYNIWERGSSGIMEPETHIGHAIPGGHFSVHDMLILRPGDRSEPNADGAEGLLPRMVQYNENGGQGPVTQAPYAYGPGGGAVYDEPPPTGANGKVAFTHYSIVRPDGDAVGIFGGGHRGFVAQDHKAERLTYSENIIVAGNGTVAPYQVETTGINEMADITALYDAATTRSERNVFVGRSLAQATARYTYRDNAGVPDPTTIGFADYANGAIDGYNLENYRLANIYSASTVTIAADGTTVTLDAGTFPSSVAAGQFFRTNTLNYPIKIRAVGSALGATWSSYAGRGFAVKRAGRVTRQKDGLLDALHTHTQALSGNQWGQVTLAVAPFDSPQFTFFDLLIRYSAPNTFNGYRIRCLGDDANPTTAQLIVLERVDAGSSAAVGPVLTIPPFAAGDVLLWEMLGTTLSFSRNGTPVASWGGDGTYASGRVGFAIRSQSNQFSNFSCGDYSGAGGSRAQVAFDNFTGGDATIQLENWHPEHTSGRLYSIGFKNSATDGRDPGVDIDTLALMTQGVGPPTVPAGVPSAPILTGTPYHAGDTAVTGTGVSSATVSLLVNGVVAGTGTVSGGGWVVSVAALVAGQTLTATQTTAGGTSSASSPSTVLAATVAPPVLTGIPYHTGDTSVTGTGIVGATVTLFVNGSSVGTTIVNGSGAWTKAVAALALGSVLTATQTTGGVTSAASNPTTVVASTAPAPPVLTGIPYHTGDTSVTGTGVVGATVTLLVDGGSVGTTTVSGGGTWTKAVTALVGGSILTATQTTGGGTSTPSSPTTVIDPPPPVVPRPPATVRPVATSQPVATVRPVNQ